MLNFFNYVQGTLAVEKVLVPDIVKTQDTPCYIYSHGALTQQWQAFDQALTPHPHKICFAVKANSNLAVLNVLAQLGSGFDIVSGGELARVLAAGGAASQVVFSGVGKQPFEITHALKQGIFCFNIESQAELVTVHEIARHLNVQAPIALRVNPDIDAQSHPYISTGLKESKFGINCEKALSLYRLAKTLPHLSIKGIASHIGSQLTQMAPIEATFMRLLTLVDELKQEGITLKHVDIGGGLGVCYRDETPPAITAYAKRLLAHCHDPKLMLVIEPGRAIAACAGILVTKVLYLKQSGNKHFCVVDAAMNDFIRPALYNAWHTIMPVNQSLSTPLVHYDVVGPICESGDFLGKDRPLQVQNGDLLAICDVGAYGFVTSSNYNTRPKAAEIMVKADQYKNVRKRETIADLLKHENIW